MGENTFEKESMKHKYLLWTIKYYAYDYTKNIKNICVYIVK